MWIEKQSLQQVVLGSWASAGKSITLEHTLISFTKVNPKQLKDFNIRHDTIKLLVLSFTCVWLFATPWTAALQASMSFTIFHNLLKLTSIESTMPSNHLIRCCPFLLLSSMFPSIKDVFSESALPIRWSSIGASVSVLPMRIFRVDLF